MPYMMLYPETNSNWRKEKNILKHFTKKVKSWTILSLKTVMSHLNKNLWYFFLKRIPPFSGYWNTFGFLSCENERYSLNVKYVKFHHARENLPWIDIASEFADRNNILERKTTASLKNFYSASYNVYTPLIWNVFKCVFIFFLIFLFFARTYLLIPGCWVERVYM